jgi:hypothetical protein
LNDKLLVVNELLEVDGTPLFHQKLVKPPAQHQWTVEPKITKVPGPGSLALPKLPVLRDAVIAYTILTAGLGCYSFSGDVLEAPTTTPVADGLMDDAGNFLTVMKDILTDLKDLDVRTRMTETLRCVNPTLTSVELDNINDPKHVIVGHAQGSGKIIEIGLANESEGFRRFYAHLLALYQRPSKQFLIFEHPEDGIHPGALSLLAEEFKVAAESGRGQVLLTTHSPRLLDSFEPDEIRVVELDGLQTRIGMLAREQRESLEEDLLDSGDLLTVDPARIDRPEQ